MTQVTQVQGKTLKSSSASSTYSSGYSSPKQWSCYGDPLALWLPVGAIAIAPNWWWIGFWYIPQLINMIPMKNPTIRLIQTPLSAHGFPIIYRSPAPSRSLSITFNYHIPILIILLMGSNLYKQFFYPPPMGSNKDRAQLQGGRRRSCHWQTSSRSSPWWSNSGSPPSLRWEYPWQSLYSIYFRLIMHTYPLSILL